VLHYAQVLGHRLPRNPRAHRQMGNGRRAVVAQPGDQPQTLLVPQRRKENGGCPRTLITA
jgi:hypothetical protein